MRTITISIEGRFLPYVDEAITRLRYLFSQWDWRADQDGVTVSGTNIDEITARKELNYALYRQKIYGETRDLRRQLYRALLR